MLKETIHYTDYDGNEQTEVAYFNLTRTELAEIDSELEGGYVNYARYASDMLIKGDPRPSKVLVDLLIQRSYGVRSEDGKRFIKTGKFEEFRETAAYDEFYMSILNDGERALRFFNGIMPKAVQDLVAEEKSLEAIKQAKTPEEIADLLENKEG